MSSVFGNFIISGLEKLEQALVAVEPSPNDFTLQIDDTVLLKQNTVPDVSNTINSESITMEFNGELLEMTSGEVTYTPVVGPTTNKAWGDVLNPTFPTPTLQDVLGAGNIAVDQSIDLQNSNGNDLYLNFPGGFPGITVTSTDPHDGLQTWVNGFKVTTVKQDRVSLDPNTIVEFLGNGNILTQDYWQGDIKTTQTSANQAHYLLFSSSNTLAYETPQKTTGISCNPNSNTITATSFIGTASTTSAVNTVTDNTNTTCYLPFTKSAAGLTRPLYVDDVTGPLTYNPSTSTLTATTFSGALSGNATTCTTASNASAVTTTSDNSNTTCYIPFTKFVAGSTRSLFVDDVTGPLSYNPSTATLTTTTFSGALSGTATNATNIATTSITTNANYYVTFVPANSTANQAAQVNASLYYNPSTGNLLSTTFTSTSDYRIKENVQTVEDVSVDKLQPKHYFNKRSGRNEFGFLAHELQEVFPDMVVGEKDGEEMQAINYTQLIPLLVHEIQQLKRSKIVHVFNN